MDVRLATADDATRDLLWPTYAAFGWSLTDEHVTDEEFLIERDRVHIAVDDGAVVGSAWAYSFDLTLPGPVVVPVAAVSNVGVLPSDRRRGALRALMVEQLADIAARGELVAALYASEAAIYGRFGYGCATFSHRLHLVAREVSIDPPSRSGGRIRTMPMADALPLIRDVYANAVAALPGGVSRNDGYWQIMAADRERHRGGASALFVAVHESDGGAIDGYVMYRVKDSWDDGLPNHQAIVVDLLGHDPEVELALWAHVLSLDLVAEVIEHGRGEAEVLRWRLSDQRRLRMGRTTDALWVRVIDLPGAMAARRYRGPGSLVLDVSDELLPANAGRWRIDIAEDGSATCEPTDATADLRCDVEAVGATLLGGVSWRELVAAGIVTEAVAGAAGRADAQMSVRPAPWCPTDF